jgi:hypothetical protein
VSEIQQQGGEAVGVSADTSDAASVKAAMESIKGKLGGRGLAAAICEFFLFYPLTFFLSWGGIYVVVVGSGGGCADDPREKITSAPGSTLRPSWRRPWKIWTAACPATRTYYLPASTPPLVPIAG